MLKKLFTVLIALTAIIDTTSCRAAKSTAPIEAPATGIITSTVKIPGSFNAVKAGSIFNIEIKQGPAKVEITSTPEAIYATKFEVSNKTLSIRLMRNGRRNNYPEIKIRISMPDIRLLDGSGASNFVINGKLDVDRLRIEGSGASNFKFTNITCTDLEIDLAGAANTDIARIDCNKCELDLSGGSKLDIEAITSVSLSAETSGGSKISIGQVKCNELEADSSGGSNINISGIDATDVECDTSGAAHIKVSGKCRKAELSASGASKISAGKLQHETINIEKSGVSTINY